MKIIKMLRNLLFQRKVREFHRKNGTSMHFNTTKKENSKYKSVFILAGLVAGLLSLVMITRQYIGVLLQGEGSTHSVVIHFNRHGELYWDGIALIGLLFIVSLALFLYLKDWKEELAHE